MAVWPAKLRRRGTQHATVFGGILEPILKASIAYIPASLVVCGVLAGLGQKALFGLSSDSFQLNAAIATGLSFWVDAAGEVLEFISGLGLLEIGFIIVVALGLLVLRRILRPRLPFLRRRSLRVVAIVLPLALLTLWRLWAIDLPATFLGDVFKFDPRILVQANSPGRLFRSRADELWRSVVCEEVPTGLPPDSTGRKISCPSGEQLSAFLFEKRYKISLIIAFATGVLGVTALKTGLFSSATGSSFRGVLIALITYQLIATPILYGRLKMRRDFPEVEVYVRAAASDFPSDAAAMFDVAAQHPGAEEASLTHVGHVSNALENQKSQRSRINGYLIDRKEKMLDLLVAIKRPCMQKDGAKPPGKEMWQWRRVELAVSDVAMIRMPNHRTERGNTLLAEYLKQPQTCPNQTKKPPM